MERSSPKKKIVWVTADYFIDCDFNPEVLSLILAEYDIHWIILLPISNARFLETEFDELQKLEGLQIEFLRSPYRQRDPRRLSYYFTIFRRIKLYKPELVYLNFVPDPYFVPVFWLLNKRTTIMCAHDGGVHTGFDFKLPTRLAFNLTFKFLRNVCMFSSSQAKLFRKNFPKGTVNVIPLGLKSFGAATASKTGKDIIFLSFGVINYSKNIDLLIDAACNIYEKGYRNFKVSINGSCLNWEDYQSRIRYPEIFMCDIRMIKNSEIPDLFATADYFVQPYRHVSQSGAMKLAFNYNLPVIASDFPGFSDEIVEDVNGYLFKPGNVQSLEELMMKAINTHQTGYNFLLERMKSHTLKNYSPTVLAGSYIKMFNAINDKESA